MAAKRRAQTGVAPKRDSAVGRGGYGRRAANASRALAAQLDEDQHWCSTVLPLIARSSLRRNRSAREERLRRSLVAGCAALAASAIAMDNLHESRAKYRLGREIDINRDAEGDDDDLDDTNVERLNTSGFTMARADEGNASMSGIYRNAAHAEIDGMDDEQIEDSNFSFERLASRRASTRTSRTTLQQRHQRSNNNHEENDEEDEGTDDTNSQGYSRFDIIEGSHIVGHAEDADNDDTMENDEEDLDHDADSESEDDPYDEDEAVRIPQHHRQVFGRIPKRSIRKTSVGSASFRGILRTHSQITSAVLLATRSQRQAPRQTRRDPAAEVDRRARNRRAQRRLFESRRTLSSASAASPLSRRSISHTAAGYGTPSSIPTFARSPITRTYGLGGRPSPAAATLMASPATSSAIPHSFYSPGIVCVRHKPDPVKPKRNPRDLDALRHELVKTPERPTSSSPIVPSYAEAEDSSAGNHRNYVGSNNISNDTPVTRLRQNSAETTPVNSPLIMTPQRGLRS